MMSLREMVMELAANDLVKKNVETIVSSVKNERNLYFTLKPDAVMTKKDYLALDDLCSYESGYFLMDVDEIYEAKEECGVEIKTIPVYRNGEVLI